jgi:integrator complex subunit 1
MVVHAIVSLLTYGAPQLEQQSTCFGRLLEIWFPASGVQPQAYLVETTEEAHLYPDWIKLRMIRSSVDPIVDTALKDLEPAQMILFIQSFGFPVLSMSKLLQTLDRMVQDNPFAFVEVDIDKVYIQQLLQVLFYFFHIQNLLCFIDLNIIADSMGERSSRWIAFCRYHAVGRYRNWFDRRQQGVQSDPASSPGHFISSF